MRAQMSTGLFQYEPCELTFRGGALCLSMEGGERLIELRGLDSAALTLQRAGGRRLELATRGERFEFLLPELKDDEETAALLHELTKSRDRLELRMRAE